MKKTIVVSAFPATGKSYMFNCDKFKDRDIIDSDSSTFPKDSFPSNYIDHIKSNIGVRDMILVSTHKEVLEALVKANIDFCLVYPNKSLRDEYIQRYIKRGSPDSFLGLLYRMWDSFIGDLDELEIPKENKMILHTNQFLSDIEWSF